MVHVLQLPGGRAAALCCCGVPHWILSMLLLCQPHCAAPWSVVGWLLRCARHTVNIPCTRVLTCCWFRSLRTPAAHSPESHRAHVAVDTAVPDPAGQPQVGEVAAAAAARGCRCCVRCQAVQHMVHDIRGQVQPIPWVQRVLQDVVCCMEPTDQCVGVKGCLVHCTAAAAGWDLWPGTVTVEQPRTPQAIFKGALHSICYHLTRSLPILVSNTQPW